MDPTNNFLDNPMDISASDSNALMNLDFESESVMVDPQLTMLYSGQLTDKPSDAFSLNPSIWDTQLDSSMALFDGLVQHHDNDDVPAPFEDVENATSPSTAANTVSRRTSKTSRTSSKSSVPSLASINSQQTKKRVRKPSRKKQEQQPIVVKKEPLSGGEDEEDPKRSKYLERNRVAASKCRQKKKEWVHDLEETKTELEAKHTELQREYTALLDEVSKMKNHLMTHAGCGDQNIDQWIEMEARKFVQKRTNRSEEGVRPFSVSHSASASASRRPSLADSSLNPLSPASSSVPFQLSPHVKTEDINYDHMPDDMFQ